MSPIRDILIERANLPADIRRQMAEIGVDPRGIEIMLPKFQHFTVRLFNLNFRQAAIIKQEMLAKGAEAAVPWRVCSWETGQDGEHQVLLSGTLRQFHQLVEKLKQQPFGLAELGTRLENALINYNAPSPLPLKIKDDAYDWNHTYIMGSIILAPDSFLRDGSAQPIDLALAKAEQMVAEGASFLNIGFAMQSVPARVDDVKAEEWLLTAVRKLTATVKVPLCVDTYNPDTAEKALYCGANMIRDTLGWQVPAERERRMAQVIAAAGVPAVLPYQKEKAVYRPLLRDALEQLGQSLEIAVEAGIAPEHVVLEPGIDIGQTDEANLNLLKDLAQLKLLGKPILLGISSSQAGSGMTPDLPAGRRLEEAVVSAVWGMLQGVNILRVADVGPVSTAVKMGEAIRDI